MDVSKLPRPKDQKFKLQCRCACNSNLYYLRPCSFTQTHQVRGMIITLVWSVFAHSHVYFEKMTELIWWTTPVTALYFRNWVELQPFGLFIAKLHCNSKLNFD